MNVHEIADAIREMYGLAYKVTLTVTAYDHIVEATFRDSKVYGESIRQLDQHCLGEKGYGTSINNDTVSTLS